MSYSMRFVVAPLPVSDETLFDKIKDAAGGTSARTPTASSNVPLTGIETASSSQASSFPSNLVQPNPQQQPQAQVPIQLNSTTTTNTHACANSSTSSSTNTNTNATTITPTQPSNINAPATTGQVPAIGVSVIVNPNSNQQNSNQTTFNAIKSEPVAQIAVGPRHIALLLEDGRVCRASYQIQADRLEFPPAQPNPGLQHSSSSGSNIAGNLPTHSGQPLSTSMSSQEGAMNKGRLGAAIIGNPAGIGNVITSSVIASSGSGASTGGAVPTGGGSSGGGGGIPTSAPGSSGGVPPFSGRVNISPHVGGLSVQHRQAARRGRMLRQTATRGRGATSVIMGSRAVIPAQYVPEDLINQAQVVLQGKPRSAIVRELQRTNLDVNSAVNNLLSSDNEDPEDMDESQDYLPNEDLMSLLDSSVNLPTGPASVLIDAETVFPEDVFNSYSASRLRPAGIRHSMGSGSRSERESSLASELEIRRFNPRDQSQSRRWLEHALRDQPGTDNSRMSSATPTDFTLHHKNDSNHVQNQKKSTNSPPEVSPIQISETVELWPAADKKFTQIACMHSELIALSSTGQVHQWKWSEPFPFEGVRFGDTTNYHPKAAQLNLTHEKIVLLSASCIRASVVTESSKVATWNDDSISIVANKLEHAAQNYPEFHRGGKITHLRTCSLYTCVKLESGAMYWWGVAPFSQRKKNWKKIQSKSSKSGPNGGGANDISVGSIVCLKNGPSFGDGAIGFTTKDGIPKVGRLTMSAWNITDTCAFKIIQPTDRKALQIQANVQQINDTKSASMRTRKILGQPLDFSGGALDEQGSAPSSPGVAKSSSSSERLEMPPPPSPASSTCSEPGCSPSHKRKHKHLLSLKDDERLRDEEQWNLKDVIFLEEVKKPPAAKVIKLDGNTALVRFNQRDPFGQQSDSDVNAYLQDCRMIRKDELQLAKETTSPSRIIDCQRYPKKLCIPDSVNFRTFAVSNSGIHAIVQNGSKIEYKIYQLASGKVSKSLCFSTDTNAFLGRDTSLISLYTSGESDIAVTLRDGNGSLYPLSRDFLDALREPQPLDMAPVQALSMAVHPLRDPNAPNRTIPTLVMAMALERQILIPAVLRSDPEFVRLTLASLDEQLVSQHVVASEKIDLNRNILHAAVYSCAPTPSKSGAEKSTKLDDESFEAHPSSYSRMSSSAFNDTVKRSRGKQSGGSSMPALNSPPSTLDLTSDGDSRSMQSLPESETVPVHSFEASQSEWSNSIFSKFDIDPTEQKQSAHVVLLILVESSILKPYLKDLMLQRDAHGMTPFMSAVSCRAYSAALILLDLAISLSTHEKELDTDEFMAMIYPPGSSLDNNPLYMLCANDTCSFTWTGALHINQDIFECKTCGLTKSLCCCTECARTCHKGHDCRLKKTSPTAYCDCWEKCKCKSLVPGSHFTRFKLLERLLTDTELVTYPDSKGESILLFLVQTVGRQMVEQRQYGPDRSSRHNKRDDGKTMPDHDLSPPRFARKALHKILGDWLALRTVILAGTSASQNLAHLPRVNPLLNAEDQIFLSGQQGTALLDRFTHSVLIKIGPEMLDVLLTTIIRESSSVIPSRVYEARLVAKRFVRSVARNGVVLSVELSPVNYSQPMSMLDLPNIFGQSSGPGSSNSYTSSNSWRPSQQPGSILQKCRKVFQALLPIAAEELAEIADALISPVRLGVPRPTAPFSLVNSMAEATQGSEEIFVVEPVVLPTPPNVEPIPPNPARGVDASNSLGPSSSFEQANLSENQVANNDRLREMLFDNESIAIENIDSEDADASNNTFRPSNNGESDSDSDSNADDASFQSNVDPSGARSTATGATAGSEVGASTVAYFSEPESGDSSNGEEEDEESEANDTEHDNDDISFANDDSFSFQQRRNHSLGHHHSDSTSLQHHSNHPPHSFRSTNLGQQLHWALRHRDQSLYPTQQTSSTSSASIPPPSATRMASLGLSTAYAYLDGAPARRSVITSASQPGNMSTNNELSMSTTAVGLARAFSIIIRSISDLIPILKESERSDYALTINQLKVSPTDAATIIANLEKKLNPIWEWLFKVMDSTEGQLRFGCALTNGIQAATAAANQSAAAAAAAVAAASSSHPSANAVSTAAHQYRSSGNQASLGAPPTSTAPNPNAMLAASSYFPQSAPNLLPVHPAIVARVSSNLSAHHNLNRRVTNIFDENPSRVHGSSNAAPTGSGSTLSTDASTGVRLHNPVGTQSSSATRPQSLTTRTNLAGPTYTSVARMPFGEMAEVIDGAAARRDFLSYMISLIRGHGNEHHDSLPILDVSALRHVAYVFDAHMCYLQALNRHKVSKPSDECTDDESDLTAPANQTRGAEHQFFRRSESTLFLDGVEPDPFNLPLSEALPLAEQPHLLQPTSRREELFGIPKTNVQNVNLELLPMQLSLSSISSTSCPRCIAKLQSQQQIKQLTGQTSLDTQTPAVDPSSQTSNKEALCPFHKRDAQYKCDMQHTALLGRWRLTVELFAREFLDDVGAEPGSILTDLVGFPMKENRFRKDMERLRNESAPREISLINVDRDKNTLIRQTIKELNNTFHLSERNQSRRNQELPLLACSKVKVSFKDEKGEGNGVARSFYTAFCEAILSNERLVNLEAPLFYQPGLRNFYSPRQHDASMDRLNAFRNVGRVIGICLSQSEICPIQLNRHVIKYILRKPVAWHDLAFFDPILYESLRQLILDAETNPDSASALQALDLRFCVDLCIEEGGGQVELAPGGRNIEVTSTNVYEYVRRYAIKRMVKSQEKALQALRQGVMDVIPAGALDNLTPEDFRLLLNGVGEINVQTLISYTTFIDDRGTSAGKRSSVQVDEQLGYFKKWFWSIVEKMSTKERQDLVYFWTGSPSLPASEEGFQPMPTVSIRPAEDLHLPTSNVCIFRLYIPLYSSKAILRSKLLVAIKEKNFGFI